MASTLTQRLIEARQIASDRGVGVPVPKSQLVPADLRDIIVNDFAQTLIKQACYSLSEDSIIISYPHIRDRYDYGEGVFIPDQPLYDAMEEFCRKNDIKFFLENVRFSPRIRCILPGYVNPLMHALFPHDERRLRKPLNRFSFLAKILRSRIETIENLIAAVEDMLVNNTVALTSPGLTTVRIDLQKLFDAKCRGKDGFPQFFSDNILAYMHRHLFRLGLYPEFTKYDGEDRFLTVKLPPI